MACRKCSGRGFYLENEIRENARHIVLCSCKPSEKYKRMYETVKRIKEYEPQEEMTDE